MADSHTHKKPLVVRLISMPFGPLHFPSIALAQITSAIHEQFGEQVEIHQHYLVHDFGELMGQEKYNSVCQSEHSDDPNYGDWIFSQAAFPEMPDTTEEYFQLIPSSYRSSYRAHYDKHILPFRASIPDILETLIDRHQLDQADVIGFTSMFAQTVASIAMAKALKRRNPNLFQCMGGANCEFPMGVEFVHHMDCFNAIFSGPGLVSFCAVLKCLLNEDMESIHQINGVFTRKNSATVAHFINEVAASQLTSALLPSGIKQIGDERPVSDYLELDYDQFLDDYDAKFSRDIEQPFIVFETSRGCWWGEKAHCTFCGLNGLSMAYRAMDSDAAIEFLHKLMQRYAGKVEHFECVDNIMPHHYPREVFPFLNPPDNVSFYWEVKANLKEADLQSLAQAHIWEIQPGIEAFNTGTLNLMKKGATAFTNIGLLRDASMYNIDVLYYLLMGFPAEPESVFEKYYADFPRLFHLRPPVALVPLQFHRFSPYYDQAESFGLTLAPKEFYGLSYPLEDKILRNLAYYFRNTIEQSDDIDPNISMPENTQVLPISLDKTYSAGLRRWWPPLNSGWKEWQARKDGSDGLLPAALYFRGGDQTRKVVDTRSGRFKRYKLTVLDYQILRYLEKARREDNIFKAFSSHDQGEVKASIERLYDEYQLVFKEGDQLMSLVPRVRHAQIQPTQVEQEPSTVGQLDTVQ